MFRLDEAKRVIANRLYRHMGKTDTTVGDLAKKSGVSKTGIYLILNRESNPSLSTLIKLEYAIAGKLTLSIHGDWKLPDDNKLAFRVTDPELLKEWRTLIERGQQTLIFNAVLKDLVRLLKTEKKYLIIGLLCSGEIGIEDISTQLKEHKDEL